jgi:hypothetical protein
VPSATADTAWKSFPLGLSFPTVTVNFPRTPQVRPLELEDEDDDELLLELEELLLEELEELLLELEELELDEVLLEEELEEAVDVSKAVLPLDDVLEEVEAVEVEVAVEAVEVEVVDVDDAALAEVVAAVPDDVPIGTVEPAPEEDVVTCAVIPDEEVADAVADEALAPVEAAAVDAVLEVGD